MLEQLAEEYIYWNKRINLISRKDIPYLYEHHLLYSLAIAKFKSFQPGGHILDVGTGGGLPGLPLAIVFPASHFHLIDSIGKKIRVVDELVQSLGLPNVTCQKIRAEEYKGSYDNIVGRGVSKFDLFYRRTRHLLKKSPHPQQNGILYLTGGEIMDRVEGIHPYMKIIPIAGYFNESFFETKKILFIPS